MRVCLWSAVGRTDAFTRPAALQDISVFPTSHGQLCRTHHLSPYGVPFLPRHTLRTKLSLPASTSTAQSSLHISAANKSSSESLSPDEEAAYQEFLQKRAAERKAWKQEMRRRAKFDPMASPPSQSATPSSGPPMPSAAGSPPVPLPALTRPKPPLSRPPAANPTTPASTANIRPTQSPNAVRNASNSGTTLPRPPSKSLDVGHPDTLDASNSKDKHMKIEDQENDEEDEDEIDLDAMVAMARRIMQEDDKDEEVIVLEEEEEENMDQTASRPPAAVQRPVRKTVRSAGTTNSSSRVDVGPSVGTGASAAAAAIGGAASSSQPTPSRGPPGAPAPKRRLMPIAQLQRQRAPEAAAAKAAKVPSTSGREGSSGVATAGGGTRRLASTGSSRSGSQRQQRQEEEEEEEEENQVADDLDWEALQAYEKYEQYLNEVAEEAPMRRSPSTAASKMPQPLTRPAMGTSSDRGSSSNNVLTSAAAAAAAKKTNEAAAQAKPASAGAGAPSSTARNNWSSLARVDSSGRSKASMLEGDEDDDNGNDPASRLDAQLNQWEQLIQLFEMAEKESKREAARQQKSKATEASDIVEEKEEEAAEEASLDWQALEKLFLGDQWEKELDELQTRVAAGVAEAEAAMQASETGEGSEGADEQPWKDELSTLLVGLVDISARRYLGRNLLPQTAPATSTEAPVSPGAATGVATAADSSTSGSGTGGQGTTPGAAAAPQQEAAPQLSEEERAEAYWQAPFLLLVQDDSPDPVLEYVNAAALDALRLGSFQDATAGITTATMVDDRHAPSQSEWIWAVSEAAERPEGYAIIPSLRLRGPGPDAPTILATNAAVFQVDSLQGEPIGQAVVAVDWKVLAEGK